MPHYTTSNKIKNDPIYGLISMPGGVAYDIINHPWFQRLRRIRQVGLTHFVYPGAIHSRFQHTIGCVHLMQLALDVLKAKDVDITSEEADGAILAILLHDMGHAPFSHSLENMLVNKMCHEELSLMAMTELNEHYGGALGTAIEIFTNRYHKKFLHQLVSSQIDIDRLDYLSRDSFFTGVSEGVVSYDRIIKMLNVYDDKLVVDQKGIYSIEKFLVARRLMYWQVYLHKTVFSAEQILRNIIRRAKYLIAQGEELFAFPELRFFLSNVDTIKNGQFEHFAAVDDDDISSSIKVWAKHSDTVLSYLCNSLINRRLFRVKIDNKPFDNNIIEDIRQKTSKLLNISYEDTKYLVVSDTLSNNTYQPLDEEISILDKSGKIQSIINASDMFNHEIMSKTVLKFYFCYPKQLDQPI